MEVITLKESGICTVFVLSQYRTAFAFRTETATSLAKTLMLLKYWSK